MKTHDVARPSQPTESFDLAGRSAGQMAREQAVELRHQAPVKTFLARLLGVKTDERNWRVGADGEERVGRMLERKLPDGWYVLNAVPVGERGSDIDHVVVGPAGVFTVNTKHHPQGKLWVGERAIMINGQRTDYLRNSKFEAERSEKFLTRACGFRVPVSAVLVVICEKMSIKQMPGAVTVLPPSQVARWLTNQTVRYPPGEIEAIYSVARQSSTWHNVG